ncbi:diguanylate cyclase/phosphodiesterase (GGDEF & EAL domains) with PAS/PAC sensor(s) [hydrothermal vent metagenome]|uniref:Diguanylate cyclase/phosphodiesterase (GGDEF & EAL domains) with PAS/PAC sensor(S) n=1 Tax=hydrothermal vent metagenome TaxID=652676 RepID=A0A3B1AU37_9ZZZZ
MSGQSILLVEDEAITALDEKEVVEGLGYVVTGIASSAEEAWEHIEKKCPDLVLMDIVIKGGVDGIELAEQIRQRYDVPVVFVTAYCDQAFVERAKLTEPFGYVIKPFDRRSLASNIEIAIYKHRIDQKLRKSEEHFHTVADSTYDWDYWVDADGILVYTSPSCERITGYDPDAFYRNPQLLEGIVHPDDLSALVAYDNQEECHGVIEPIEFRITTRTGEERWIERVAQRVYGANGISLGLRGTNRNITKSKANEEKLRQSQVRMDHLAHHDQLTGLPNRLLLGARFKLSLEQAKRENHSVGVLFIDLDGFKPVNDNYGHDVGDQVLTQIAARLNGCVRAEDTVARLGGDEFLVVMEKINDGKDAALLASKIQAELAPPVLVGEKQLSLTGSIGICIHPQDGKDMDTLLCNADAAMYLAKQKGPGNYCFYADEYCNGANDRANMHAELQCALNRHEFILSYKPQFDLADGGLVAAEAQICWQHPEKGLLQPTHFLPLADRLGLMSELNDWALRQACVQWMEWQASGLELGQMAVNLAESQVGDTQLASRIGGILQATGCPPEKLELEVSEVFVIRDMEADTCALARLSELGVGIAIERFGKDYCSLKQLGQIPINKLKINPELTRHVLDSPADQKIVGAIIALANSLHFKVIAEEIEDEEQKMFLASIGCAQVQGMPMTAEDFSTNLGSK